jgi:hypothetical protein
MIDSDPDNPLGYFLLGAAYQMISEEYRNDNFRQEIEDNLELALKLSGKKKKDDPDNPDWFFVAGATFGYRGLHRAFHDRWWAAFRDGWRCESNLEKALSLDSSYYDAHWGLGSYRYYKTAMSDKFLWLPFVRDLRPEAKAQISKAAEKGVLTRQFARESLLRIYWMEKRYAKLLALADSLEERTPHDPYGLFFHIEGLIGTGRFQEARSKLSQLKLAWKESVYYDSLGAFEGELLLARIALGLGDAKLAQKIVAEIISRQEQRRSNAYFSETYDKAKELIRDNRW